MPINGDGARLDEFDADEWFDVCCKLKPSLTRDEFDAMWAEFAAGKKPRVLS